MAVNKKKKSFVWTDKKVLLFAKMTTSEVYGIMNGKKTLKEKLKHFKNL